VKLLFSCLSKWAKAGFRVSLKELEKAFEKFVFYYIKQIDSRVPLVCSCHTLTSSVIYHWADARHLGIYLTNRFHVALRLFTNRSQMTSKCVKNKKVAHEAIAFSFFFLLLVPVQWYDSTRRFCTLPSRSHQSSHSVEISSKELRLF